LSPEHSQSPLLTSGSTLVKLVLSINVYSESVLVISGQFEYFLLSCAELFWLTASDPLWGSVREHKIKYRKPGIVVHSYNPS
jgi:hypothetical protein